jgi:phage terminase large subunit-like protein
VVRRQRHRHRDPAGARKFDKAKSTGRIDALVALAMALWR